MDTTYLSAIVILVVAVLNAFGIKIATDAVNGIVLGVIALIAAIAKYREGNISLAGFKKQ
jgi:uncharacterized membrane protein